MLTSDLLRFSNRNKKVSPTLLKKTDNLLISELKETIKLFNTFKGVSLKEAKETLIEKQTNSSLIHKGMQKLLFDKCEFEDNDSEVYTERWQLFQIAAKLKKDKSFNNIQEFEKELEKSSSRNIEKIRERLFQDLPEKKIILKTPKWNEWELFNRYNVSQVQGLILRSRNLEITAAFSSVAEKRLFFRQIKFYRLIAEVEKYDQETVKIKLGGPLTVFENSQSYGIRLANFFPYILQLKDFKVEALVSIKNKTLPLTIDFSMGLESYYKRKTTYLPEEYSLFLEGFNQQSESKKNSAWQANVAESGEYIKVQGNHYCFPDFKISSKNKKSKDIYFELFHKWHKSQLEPRLESLSQSKNPFLLIGICRTLKNNKEVTAWLNRCKIDEHKIIWFSSFPSAKKVWEKVPSFW